MERLRDLPPVVRGILFAVVAALVLTLWWKSSTTDTPRPDPETTTTATTATSPDAPAPEASPAPTGASPSAAPSHPSTPRIQLQYPVSDADLQAAAQTAAQFTTLYAGFRYDEPIAERQQQLAVMLSRDNTVDLSALAPTGQTLRDVQSSQTVITAQVQAVKASLVATDTIVYAVMVQSTTTFAGKVADASTQVYSVTFSHDQTWQVSQIALSGTAANLD